MVHPKDGSGSGDAKFDWISHIIILEVGNKCGPNNRGHFSLHISGPSEIDQALDQRIVSITDIVLLLMLWCPPFALSDFHFVVLIISVYSMMLWACSLRFSFLSIWFAGNASFYYFDLLFKQKAMLPASLNSIDSRMTARYFGSLDSCWLILRRYICWRHSWALRSVYWSTWSTSTAYTSLSLSSCLFPSFSCMSNSKLIIAFRKYCTELSPF